MHFAYADPPYIGQAKKHYSHDPNCAEVDHKFMIDLLCDLHPDGWALSASSTSLKEILGYCPGDVRVMAWVKPFAIFKPNVGLAYAWEPVILRGGRKRSRDLPTCRDWIAENITLKKGLAGVKPERVCYWLFNAFGAQPDDHLSDWFPGSGIVGRAWQTFVSEGGVVEIGGTRK